MKISAIDYSINSPGIITAILDKNLDVINYDFLGFTSVAINSKNKNIKHYHKDEKKRKFFSNSIEKNLWFVNQIMEFVNDSEYVAIEGYSFASKGVVFNIAESTMLMKFHMYNSGISIRVYDPKTIKMFATNNGNAKKEEMVECYNKLEEKIDFGFLPEELRDGNPKGDLVDAFFILKLLQTELKLRYGLIELKTLTLKQIEIFNRTTKKNPNNILSTDFLKIG
jgi:hypothetical protein